MIPSRRFDTLLEQARQYQRNSCLYHNSSAPFSLYTDHVCGRELFPSMTTVILEGHANEVWDVQWSHDGWYLATASSDNSAIIWKLGVSLPNSSILLFVTYLVCVLRVSIPWMDVNAALCKSYGIITLMSMAFHGLLMTRPSLHVPTM